ncbi:hypothetical protein JCM33374_g5028 [Metschnikowia sp. JCM 33374]|nr:hypothetical protein JCM33374_g5028 [Metschnikowia sp. JCM 33374]
MRLISAFSIPMAVSAIVLAAPSGYFTVYKREDHPQKAEIELAEKQLENVYGSIRSFVNETSFDALGFDDHFPVLEKEISNIQSVVEKIMPPKRELSDQFDFVRDKFRTMVASKENILGPEVAYSPEDFVISSITDLEMKLLLVQTSRGAPDLTRNDYVGTVIRFKERFSFLEIVKDEMPPISTLKFCALEFMFNKVETALRLLASQFPVTEI